MNMRLDRANLADLHPIMALMEAAYRGQSSRLGWTSEADLIDGTRITADELTQTLTNPNSHMIVARDMGGTIIGCASIQFDGKTCEFGKFAVSPSLQAQGLGKTLLEASEKAAISQFGCTKMSMLVIKGRTELEAFYARRGYKPTGAQVRMGDLHVVDDMTKGFDLVLLAYEKDLQEGDCSSAGRRL